MESEDSSGQTEVNYLPWWWPLKLTESAVSMYSQMSSG